MRVNYYNKINNPSAQGCLRAEPPLGRSAPLLNSGLPKLCGSRVPSVSSAVPAVVSGCGRSILHRGMLFGGRRDPAWQAAEAGCRIGRLVRPDARSPVPRHTSRWLDKPGGTGVHGVSSIIEAFPEGLRTALTKWRRFERNVRLYSLKAFREVKARLRSLLIPLTNPSETYILVGM